MCLREGLAAALFGCLITNLPTQFNPHSINKLVSPVSIVFTDIGNAAFLRIGHKHVQHIHNRTLVIVTAIGHFDEEIVRLHATLKFDKADIVQHGCQPPKRIIVAFHLAFSPLIFSLDTFCHLLTTLAHFLAAEPVISAQQIIV